MDRDAGRSKGFGFVEMGSDQEAQAAIAALGGKDITLALTVNEARPKTEGGGGRGGSGGGYGGGGGLILGVPSRNSFRSASGGVYPRRSPMSFVDAACA